MFWEKLWIIQEVEENLDLCKGEIVWCFNILLFMLSMILKNKCVILVLECKYGVVFICCKINKLFFYDKFEGLFIVWFQQICVVGLLVKGIIFKEKVLCIVEELGMDDFIVFNGWLDCFCWCYGVVFCSGVVCVCV